MRGKSLTGIAGQKWVKIACAVGRIRQRGTARHSEGRLPLIQYDLRHRDSSPPRDDNLKEERSERRAIRKRGDRTPRCEAMLGLRYIFQNLSNRSLNDCSDRPIELILGNGQFLKA